MDDINRSVGDISTNITKNITDQEDTANPIYSILFMGTADFSVTICKALIEDKRFNVIGMVSQPDKKVGRKQLIEKTPIHQLADKQNIPCYFPSNLKEECIDLLKKNPPDFIVSASYGKILPVSWLTLPKIKAINVHTSLLPLYRGASPVQHSILNGDKKTGISIIEMVKEMDAGGIYKQVSLETKKEDTTKDLMNKLSLLATKYIGDTLIDIANGQLAIKQKEDKATYVSYLTKKDGEICFEDDANKIDRLIRATYPWPIAYSFFNGQKISIHKASVVSLDVINQLPDPKKLEVGRLIVLQKKRLFVCCGKDTDEKQNRFIELNIIQLAGKKLMNVCDCAHNFKTNGHLGS